MTKKNADSAQQAAAISGDAKAPPSPATRRWTACPRRSLPIEKSRR